MVVDDHDLTRPAIVRAIRKCNDMEVVAQAVNGRQAVAANFSKRLFT
jgi:DNA-binding NarL/FixJ family response regulator